MSLMTIEGTPVDIVVKKVSDGKWMAYGRIYDGVLPEKKAINVEGSDPREVETLCKEQLERLIHARTCVAE